MKIALNCLVFEKIAFLQFGDRQTNRWTDPLHEAALADSRCRERRLNKYKQMSLQEAQLSQKDRATLRVIEYFAKSLTVTQGHSI